MLRFAGFLIDIIAAVPQETEIIFGNTCNLKENIILSVVVKVGKGELTVSVSHDKARNGSGKTAKMRTDVVLNGLLFIFLLLGFHPFNYFFGFVLDSLFNLLLHCLRKLLQRISDRRLIGLLGLLDFFLRLRL